MEATEEDLEFDSSSLAGSLILVVEDGMTTAAILAHVLSKEGYRVVSTSSGEEAIEAAPSLQPDLILLDIKMEGMDGFETCSILKKMPHTRDVPIFFTTSLDDGEAKLKGFRYGAVDYIVKPYHREELLARIRIHLRFRLSYKALMANQLKQLQSLREAQTSLLPDPADYPAARFYSYFSAKHDAGGDFFDLFRVNDHVYDYVVADVSGHELGSSLATAALKSALQQNHNLSYTPLESLSLINDLLRSFLKPGQYLTLAYLRVDRQRGKATLLNAAHTPLIHQSEACKVLEKPGDPLGCFEHFTPSVTSFKVDKGDRLFMFTDGIIEEFQGNPVSRSRGIQELQNCFQQTKSMDLRLSIETSIQYLHPAPDVVMDDLLLLGIAV